MVCMLLLLATHIMSFSQEAITILRMLCCEPWLMQDWLASGIGIVHTQQTIANTLALLSYGQCY